jgi:hypothetical protein
VTYENVSIKLSSLDENPMEGTVGQVLASAEVAECAGRIPVMVDAATLVERSRVKITLMLFLIGLPE